MKGVSNNALKDLDFGFSASELLLRLVALVSIRHQLTPVPAFL